MSGSEAAPEAAAARRMQGAFRAAADALSALAGSAEAARGAAKAAEAVLACLRAGGKVLTCGNGGSAADSQHLASELVGRFQRERAGFAAVALTTDTSAITSISNDYGYAEVFRRQVEALGREGDVLVAFSTSGNAESVLRAVDEARYRKLLTVGLTGTPGGRLAEAADVPIRVPAEVTARIQELHTVVYHAVCDAVERGLLEAAGPGGAR